MAERFMKQSPHHADAAKWLATNFGRFSDAVKAWNQVCELRDRMQAYLTRPIPKADAVKAFKAARDNAYENHVVPLTAECLYRLMTRSPRGSGFDAVFDRDRPTFILGLLPDDVIDAAADRLVEPESALSMADQGKEKAELEKTLKKAKAVITAKIPAEFLTNDDFYRTKIYEAFYDWTSLAGMMTRACDPWGLLLTSDNEFYDAFDYLGLKAGGEDARFNPAGYDPHSYKVF